MWGYFDSYIVNLICCKQKSRLLFVIGLQNNIGIVEDCYIRNPAFCNFVNALNQLERAQFCNRRIIVI